MKVLAIDPGERVGWAHGVIQQPGDTWAEGGGPVQTRTEPALMVTGHGIATLKDMALKLHEVAGNYDVIVFEEYRISSNPQKLKAHVGSDVPTLQLVGMIRLCAWLNPQAKLVTQYPKNKATAERSMPAWLREKIAGLPARHDDAHDGDALLHLWFYYWKTHV